MVLFLYLNSSPGRYDEILECAAGDDAGITHSGHRRSPPLPSLLKRTSRLDPLRCDSMFTHILPHANKTTLKKMNFTFKIKQNGVGVMSEKECPCVTRISVLDTIASAYTVEYSPLRP